MIMGIIAKAQGMSRPVKALAGATLAAGLLFTGIGAANAATGADSGSTRVPASTPFNEGDPTSAPLGAEGGDEGATRVPATTSLNQGDSTSAPLAQAK